MSDAFIPNGNTFIANLQVGTTFNGNVTSTSPGNYWRVTNLGGDSASGAGAGVWFQINANPAAQISEFFEAADSDWLAQNVGTFILPQESIIVSFPNGQQSVQGKQVSVAHFVANVDPTATGTYEFLTVQPVLPA